MINSEEHEDLGDALVQHSSTSSSMLQPTVQPMVRSLVTMEERRPPTRQVAQTSMEVLTTSSVDYFSNESKLDNDIGSSSSSDSDSEMKRKRDREDEVGGESTLCTDDRLRGDGEGKRKVGGWQINKEEKEAETGTGTGKEVGGVENEVVGEGEEEEVKGWQKKEEEKEGENEKDKDDNIIRTDEATKCMEEKDEDTFPTALFTIYVSPTAKANKTLGLGDVGAAVCVDEGIYGRGVAADTADVMLGLQSVKLKRKKGLEKVSEKKKEVKVLDEVGGESALCTEDRQRGDGDNSSAGGEDRDSGSGTGGKKRRLNESTMKSKDRNNERRKKEDHTKAHTKEHRLEKGEKGEKGERVDSKQASISMKYGEKREKKKKIIEKGEKGKVVGQRCDIDDIFGF